MRHRWSVPLCLLAGLVPAAPAAAKPVTVQLGTGAWQRTIPAGVKSLHLELAGAPGGEASADRGLGATSAGDLQVTPGSPWWFVVGGAGSEALLGGAGGGGATDVRSCASAVCDALPGLDRRVATVGGGGGASIALRSGKVVRGGDAGFDGADSATAKGGRGALGGVSLVGGESGGAGSAGQGGTGGAGGGTPVGGGFNGGGAAVMLPGNGGGGGGGGVGGGGGGHGTFSLDEPGGGGAGGSSDVPKRWSAPAPDATKQPRIVATFDDTDAPAITASVPAVSSAPVVTGRAGTVLGDRPHLILEVRDAAGDDLGHAELDAAPDGTFSVQLRALPDGPYAILVRQSDEAGHEGTARLATEVDAAVPVVTVRVAEATTDPRPPVTFSSTAKPGATSTCRVDGGAWEACTSPWRPGPLAPGPHRVEVLTTSRTGVPAPAPAGADVRVDAPPAETPATGDPQAPASGGVAGDVATGPVARLRLTLGKGARTALRRRGRLPVRVGCGPVACRLRLTAATTGRRPARFGAVTVRVPAGRTVRTTLRVRTRRAALRRSARPVVAVTVTTATAGLPRRTVVRVRPPRR